jgi:hydrogenase maturation protein HypF
MVADIAAAEALCEVSAKEREVLASSARPIVLLRRRAGGQLAEAVAPGNPRTGVMLAYTPLHHLLLRDLDGVPLVLTSGNRSDEPIAYEDRDALDRLVTIADVFLLHDRPIHMRCDDSVAQVVPGDEAVTMIRRSRGFAPVPIALPFHVAQPTLAVGGHLKATFAFGVGRRAYVSHHLGDLDEYQALRAYREAIEHYQRLFRVEPRRIAHDAHPDYASTREALTLASGGNTSIVSVQHHHAHMASCMAENGLSGRVIGVCFDGAGLGSDGAIWGGELLVGDYATVRRAAHLAYVGMPGGERAMREPWRMAVAFLRAAHLDPRQQPLASRIPSGELEAVLGLLDRGKLCPTTSSVGRLFDAVAALAGVRDRSTFEGQAAMELEALAQDAAPCGAYAMDIVAGHDGLVVDPRPLVRQVVDDVKRGVPPSAIARRFHDGLAEAIVTVCVRIREDEGVADVALSGGVFVNAALSAQTAERLGRADFRVHRHRVVPPNDGGLCLGQLAVAAAVDAQGGQ